MLTISFARRMLAAGIWVAVLLFSMEFLRLYSFPRWVTYPLMLLSFVALLWAFERVVLLERRAFTCRKCGYDLRGLPENRCPECATEFDPAEQQRILARIHSPPPRPRHRWIAALVVVLLALSVAAGLVAYKRASRTPTTPTAPTTAPTKAATSNPTQQRSDAPPAPRVEGRIDFRETPRVCVAHVIAATLFTLLRAAV